MLSRHTYTVIAASLAIATASAGGDTIYVDDDNCPGPGSGTEEDPYCLIQTAIDAAVDGDEVIVARGTYFEQIDFIGKAITLRSSDGPDVTTIDAQGTGLVVTCETGEGPTTVLDGFTITGGQSLFGGGMSNVCSSPTVINCNFVANAADGGFGGGMYNHTGSPTVRNCRFFENTAAAGGGMFSLDGSQPIVINCTFASNQATLNGGGVYNFFAASPVLANCTFNQNQAGGSGGGMYSTDPSTPMVTNCIFWDNTPQEIIDSLSASTTVQYSDIGGGWFGSGSNNIDADPMFIDAPGNDLHLLPGSPCIDAGDNTAVPNGIDADLDGSARFADDLNTTDTGNGDCPIVDMGAYELPTTCPWDLDCDGSVSTVDLLDLLAQWGTDPGGPPDFDGDGNVGTTDLLELLANWGSCP